MYCNRCKTEKPKTEFFRRKNRKCGRLSVCKACRLKDTKRRMQENREKGLCWCGRPSAEGTVRCASCIEVQRKYDRKKRKIVKESGLCATCRKSPREEGYSECGPCALRRAEKHHGATGDDRKRMFDEQGGKCPVCGLELTGWARKKDCVVDHCHDTGQIRGLLHNVCNRAIGFFGDDPVRLRAAAAYLEGYNTNKEGE